MRPFKIPLAPKLSLKKSKNKLILIAAVFPILIFSVYLSHGLSSPQKNTTVKNFFIISGDSSVEIANHLETQGLIRSSFAFNIFGFITGQSSRIKPGRYELSSDLGGSKIMKILVSGGFGEIRAVIPEGLSVYEIDKILSDQKIIKRGELIAFNSRSPVEGRLFPDTYRFSINSKINDVVDVLLENFKEKAEPILNQDPKNFEKNLILASLVEDEVPGSEDQRVVAGIIKKRLATNMRFQIDATVCYSKRQKDPQKDVPCYPLTSLDLKINSPYNTYLNVGWPPGPIGSPGVSAISAALKPKNSPFWFYISDPVTKKTIFARTLDEHNANVSIYLKS
ncbi:MAG: endolytic transglycosylase MltG [Candidatus Paceibacterota bacterium]|jgi:UPF0755 protein